MTNEEKTIIVVDDNNANLIACKSILKSHYVVYPAASSAKMFELLEHVMPNLILMDVEMPEVDGYETVRKLKSSDAYKEIPVIFFSARSDAPSEMEGLKLGAIDYIHKPFSSAVLLKRIEIHLSLFEYKKTIEEQNSTIEEQTKTITELQSRINELSKQEDIDDSLHPTQGNENI